MAVSFIADSINSGSRTKIIGSIQVNHNEASDGISFAGGFFGEATERSGTTQCRGHIRQTILHG
jgi:hypothetical protein